MGAPFSTSTLPAGTIRALDSLAMISHFLGGGGCGVDFGVTLIGLAGAGGIGALKFPSNGCLSGVGFGGVGSGLLLIAILLVMFLSIFSDWDLATVKVSPAHRRLGLAGVTLEV
jgi:hypothetical protein